VVVVDLYVVYFVVCEVFGDCEVFFLELLVGLMVDCCLVVVGFGFVFIVLV